MKRVRFGLKTALAASTNEVSCWLNNGHEVDQQNTPIHVTGCPEVRSYPMSRLKVGKLRTLQKRTNIRTLHVRFDMRSPTEAVFNLERLRNVAGIFGSISAEFRCLHLREGLL